MGTLINQVLGDPKGKIGNVIYTIRNKKVISYVAPPKIKISESPKAIASRQRLDTQSKFQSFINQIAELHDIWKSTDVYASDAYRKIGKVNSKYLNPQHPTIKNSIVPITNKDPIIEIEAEINSSGLNLKVRILDKQFVPEDKEKYLTWIAVISYYLPRKENKAQFHLYKMATDSIDFRAERTFEISFPFDEEGKENYYLYSKSILYFTLLSKDCNGEVVKYTKQYSKEFTNNIPLEEQKAMRKVIRKAVKINLKDRIKRKFKRLLRKVLVKALEYTEE
jgi:hypothetical protein